MHSFVLYLLCLSISLAYYINISTFSCEMFISEHNNCCFNKMNNISFKKSLTELIFKYIVLFYF